MAYQVLLSRQMKKAKTKSPAETDISYQKPALRSEAFARALNEAKLRVVGSGGLRSLFEKAAKEAASLPRHRFKANWPYLQTMLRLVRAYERGEYKQSFERRSHVDRSCSQLFGRPIRFDSGQDSVSRLRR
jgi:hypothetical protein